MSRRCLVVREAVVVFVEDPVSRPARLGQPEFDGLEDRRLSRVVLADENRCLAEIKGQILDAAKVANPHARQSNPRPAVPDARWRSRHPSLRDNHLVTIRLGCLPEGHRRNRKGLGGAPGRNQLADWILDPHQGRVCVPQSNTHRASSSRGAGTPASTRSPRSGRPVPHPALDFDVPYLPSGRWKGDRTPASRTNPRREPSRASRHPEDGHADPAPTQKRCGPPSPRRSRRSARLRLSREAGITSAWASRRASPG